jgi:iron complex outermembrane recepter protein
MSPRRCLLACALLGVLALPWPALAQSTVTLPEIVVSGPLKPPRHRRPARPKPQPRPPVVAAPVVPQPTLASGMPGPAPIKERYLLPQTVESVTAERIEQTTNVVDTEDAVKYMPSLFVRKRNAGDNQAVLATRSWGLSSSARTLIYADDILLSSLIGNNNSNASPRWGMVAPEEIKRIDFLYGRFRRPIPATPWAACSTSRRGCRTSSRRR